MSSFDELRAAVLELFARFRELAASHQDSVPEAARRSGTAYDRLVGGHLTTAVCGEFKRGKSTLLSALLDEPGLLPSDTLPATNIVTIVRWGETERVRVTLSLPGGDTKVVEITRAQLADYVTEKGNPGNVREAVLAEIEIPNPKLASGLVFVDTPGVGGVLTEHTAVTLAFLPGADALLFIMDVEKPLLDSELAFLRRAIDAAKLTDDVDSLVCAMTKIDQGTEYEELYDDTLNKLAELTGRPAKDVALIPVSSWEKLHFLADGDADSLKASNFPALEAALWAALGRRRARVLLGGALHALSQEAAALLAPIEAAEQSAQDETGATLADLQRQAQDRRDHLTRLATESKGWEARLTAELKRAQEQLTLRALGELDRNWSRFNSEYVNNPRYVDDPGLIADQLAADLAALLGGLQKLIRREVAAATERFSAANQFDVTVPDIGGLPDLPPPELPNAASLAYIKPRSDNVPVVRGTTIGAGAGGTVGGVLGAALGGLLGSFIAPGPGTVAGTVAGAQWGATIFGAVGGVLGFRSAKETVKAKDTDRRRREIVDVFKPAKESQRIHITGLIKLKFDEIRPTAIAELSSRITLEKQTVENVLRRLAARQRSTQQDRDADHQRYAAERKPFDDALAEAGELAREVNELAERPGG